MNVTLGIRLTESDHKALKDVAGMYSDVSTVLVSIMEPFLLGKRMLPAKTPGKERQTTCTVDHTVKMALLKLAGDNGLSPNEAIQFMVHDFVTGLK